MLYLLFIVNWSHRAPVCYWSRNQVSRLTDVSVTAVSSLGLQRYTKVFIWPSALGNFTSFTFGLLNSIGLSWATRYCWPVPLCPHIMYIVSVCRGHVPDIFTNVVREICLLQQCTLMVHTVPEITTNHAQALMFVKSTLTQSRWQLERYSSKLVTMPFLRSIKTKKRI